MTDLAPAETPADVTDPLWHAVAGAEREVPTFALVSDLPDALRMLGALQAAADRLGAVIAQCERDLLDRGADTCALDDGTTAKREAGSLSYEWAEPRDVAKALAPDLIARLGSDAWDLLDRIIPALPRSVQWKAAEVNRYALADELRTSKRSRSRLKVAMPADPGPAAPATVCDLCLPGDPCKAHAGR